MWRLIVLSALTIMASFSPAESEKTGEEVCGRYGRWLADEDSKTVSTNVVALPSKTPWMVILTIEYSSRYTSYVTDGVLIHPQAVLVPRNGIYGTNVAFITVVAGNGSSIQKRLGSYAIMESYGMFQPVKNPVAILKLASPFELSGNVGILCVPQSYDKYNQSRCFASEWSGPDVYKPTDEFETVRAFNISYVRCPNEYNSYNRYIKDRDIKDRDINDRDINDRYINDRYKKSGSICAGIKIDPENKCPNSYKGSLFCQHVDDSSRYDLIGIGGSFGVCEIVGSHRLYDFVDVVHFRDWIDRKMSENGMKMSVC